MTMPKIEVSNETYEKIKDQLLETEKCDIASLDDMVGKKFFFRTVTYHCVGRVIKLIGRIAQLEEASWIADSGRFSQAIKNGTFDEVEPVGEMFVNLDSVTDFFPVYFDLPKEQK